MAELDGRTVMPTADSIVTRNFLALGGGEAAARAIAFVATVYIARVLGAPYFGIVAFSAAVLLYLGRLVDGGLDQGLGIQLIASKRARIERLAFTLLVARFTIAAGLALSLLLIGTLLLPQPDGAVLAAFGLLLFPLALSTRWLHLGLERARFVAIARIAGELAMVVLVFAFVRSPKDVLAVPLAQFAGDTLAALLLVGGLIMWGYRPSFALHWRPLRAISRRAAPLVLASLLSLLIFNADLLVLRIFRGASAVGLYVAAYALISFFGNLMSAYGASLLPTLARLANRSEEQLALYRTASAHATAVALPVTVGGFLLAPEIIGAVFGEAYGPAALPLRILVWSICLGALREVARVGMLARGREDRILRMNIWGTAMNVSANLVLIPLFGMAGAAAATIGTETLRLGIIQRFATQEGLAPARLRRFWRPVAATAFMATVLAVLNGSQLWISIPAGAAAYAAALIVTGGLRVRWGKPLRLDI
jgi:O-antigen/teichoic acid export membrane protein